MQGKPSREASMQAAPSADKLKLGFETLVATYWACLLSTMPSCIWGVCPKAVATTVKTRMTRSIVCPSAKCLLITCCWGDSAKRFLLKRSEAFFWTCRDFVLVERRTALSLVQLLFHRLATLRMCQSSVALTALPTSRAKPS